MKKLLKVVVWVLVIAVALLLFAELFLDKAIKGGVNTFGSKLLGVETRVEDVDFSLLRGVVSLNKLHVGNPEGFDAESLLDLEKAEVHLNFGALFADPMVIESIEVAGLDVTYEQNLTENNIGKLLDNLNAGKEEKEEEEEPAKPAKKVVIKKFDLSDSHVKIALVGDGLPVKIPDMHLENIGEQSGGMTGVDVISELFKDLLQSIGGLVVDVGGLAVDGVKAVGGLAADGVSAIGDGAMSAVGAVTGLFSSDDDAEEEAAPAEEAAAEQSEAAAEAAEESAGGVTDALSGAGDAVVGAITGLFSSDDAAEEAPAEAAAEDVAEEASAVAEEAAAAAEETEAAAEESAGGVTEALSDAGDAVAGALSDASDAVTGAISGLFSSGSGEAAAE